VREVRCAPPRACEPQPQPSPLPAGDADGEAAESSAVARRHDEIVRVARKEELHGNSVGPPFLSGGPWRGVSVTAWACRPGSALIVGPATGIAGAPGEERGSVCPEERGETADSDASFGVRLTDSLLRAVSVARRSRTPLARASVGAPMGGTVEVRRVA
jgi:RNA 3'-terminal phosphate cyclase